MRGNPFLKEAMTSSDILGRKKEIYELTGFMDNAIIGRNMLVEVIGPAGIGKTMFLKKINELAEKSKCLCAHIRIQKKERKEKIMKRILEQIFESAVEGIAEKSIPFKLERFFGEYSIELRKKIDAKEISLEEIVDELSKAYNKIKESTRALVFLLDDIETGLQVNEIHSMIEQLSEKLKELRVPSLFVLSSSYSIANERYRKIMLEPLTEHEMHELVEKLLKPTKIKSGEEFMRELITDCGGNPTILLTTCWVIFDRLGERDRLITKGHYLASHSAIINRLGQEMFDEIYQSTSPSEKEILRAISRESSMRIIEIAKKTKKPINVVTRLVLRLVESGSLTKIKRGEYQVFNKLYGKYIQKQIV